jgi:hypothetical protein
MVASKRVITRIADHHGRRWTEGAAGRQGPIARARGRLQWRTSAPEVGRRGKRRIWCGATFNKDGKPKEMI